MDQGQKTALVTGGATRIGKEISLLLVNRGWHVVIHYFTSEEAAYNLVKNINNATDNCASMIQADFRDYEAVNTIFPKINQQRGVVSLLINNAASFINDNVHNSDKHSWQQNMNINAYAPFTLSQKFFQQYHGNSGNIINIIDYCVLNFPKKKYFSYAMSKSLLANISRELSVEFAPSVRVNAISPAQALINERQSAENFSASWHDTPLGRSTNPEEICKAIEFILDVNSLTGQMITLDGGKHLDKDRKYK
jgi:NAD(P)-dependent dehydrogenase (short-subunit alcohol dehydrogenase family)